MNNLEIMRMNNDIITRQYYMNLLSNEYSDIINSPIDNIILIIFILFIIIFFILLLYDTYMNFKR